VADERERGVKERMWAAGVLGGLALVAVLALIVLKFGRIDPSPPSLRDDPNSAIPGQIVYLDNDDCVIRTAASGEWHEKVLCEKGAQYVTWLDGGRIGVVSYGPQTTWFEVNLETGERTARNDQPPTSSIANRPDDVITDRGEVQVTGSATTGRETIADFDMPESASLVPLTWSPDRAWLLLAYHGPRGGGELWILSRDGQTQGTLAGNTAAWKSVSWWIEGAGTAP